MRPGSRSSAGSPRRFASRDRGVECHATQSLCCLTRPDDSSFGGAPRVSAAARCSEWGWARSVRLCHYQPAASITVAAASPTERLEASTEKKHRLLPDRGSLPVRRTCPGAIAVLRVGSRGDARGVRGSPAARTGADTPKGPCQPRRRPCFRSSQSSTTPARTSRTAPAPR